MRAVLVSLLFWFGVTSHAQERIDWGSQISDSSAISLVSDGFISSPQFSNAFFNQLMFQDQLSVSDIDEQLGALSDQNLIGGGYSIGAAAHFEAGNGTDRWLFSILNRGIVSAQLSRDLFALVFQGNAQYAGETLRFDDQSIELFQFMEISAGINRPILGGRGAIRVSLLEGQQAFEASTNESWLHTNLEGTELSAELDAALSVSDTGSNAFFYPNGWGGSLAFGYETSMLFKGRAIDLSFSAEDLGVLFWNSSSVEAQFDTAFAFSGIDVGNITSFNEPEISNSASVDSLAGSFENRLRKGTFSTRLPAFFQVRASTKVSGKIALSVFADARLGSINTSSLGLMGVYELSDKLSFNGVFQLGGFGGINSEIGATYCTDRIVVRGQIRHLEDILFSSGKLGAGGMLVLGWRL